MLFFDALERRRPRSALLAPASHAATALLTLVNFTHDGCLITVALLLATGAGVAAAAGRVWWLRTTSTPRPGLRRPDSSSSGRSTGGVGAAEPDDDVSGVGGTTNVPSSSAAALARTMSRDGAATHAQVQFS